MPIIILVAVSIFTLFSSSKKIYIIAAKKRHMVLERDILYAGIWKIIKVAMFVMVPLYIINFFLKSLS